MVSEQETSREKPRSYLESGVNIALADQFVGHIKNLTGHTAAASGKLLPGAGGYAAVYKTDSGLNVACTTDGVGSKLLLCEELDRFDTIGIDLVAMCANDIICVGAAPALFLDYYACGSLDLKRSTSLIEGIVAGCKLADMLLVGGETAEMPDLYQSNHFDLAGFAVGFVAEGKLLTGESLKEGDFLVAVSSSGLHSNGFSLARKLIPEGSPLRAELLTPTEIYVRPFLQVLNELGSELTGAANITGGGWTNLLRLNKDCGFALKAMELSPVFEELARHVEPAELYRTFNMGMGFAVMVRSAEAARAAIDIFARAGFAASVQGKVKSGHGVEIDCGRSTIFLE